MFSMFCIYAVVTVFGGDEFVSCRSSFDQFFKARGGGQGAVLRQKRPPAAAAPAAALSKAVRG